MMSSQTMTRLYTLYILVYDVKPSYDDIVSIVHIVYDVKSDYDDIVLTVHLVHSEIHRINVSIAHCVRIINTTLVL